MLNYIWLGLILCSVVFGGLGHQIETVAQEGIKGAREAVEIALKLIGVMAMWLGMMRLAERAGLIQLLAQGIRPLMRRLFPDVPPEHPAMGAMLMNMAANVLGIGNAATPLGLRAMRDLQRLNPTKDTASNAMCTFLAINTSSLQLIPANQIALLAAAGSVRPTAIIGTALAATTISTLVGIVSVKLLEKVGWFRIPAQATALASDVGGVAGAEAGQEEQASPAPSPAKAVGFFGWSLLALFAALFAWLFLALAFPKDALRAGEARVVVCENGKAGKVIEGAIAMETSTNIVLRSHEGNEVTLAKNHPAACPKAGDLKAQILRESNREGGDGALPAHFDRVQRYSAPWVRWIDAMSVLAIPFLVAFFPLYAVLRGIKVYEEFVEGAKEGFQVAVTVIPHVVAMLIAVFMFRSAGCIDAIANWSRPVLELLHFPAELLPLSLMRPISGGGTTGIFVELIRTYGPDHLITRTAGTIIGSTETTLYVVAVYFGSVAIQKTRHAIAAGLLADVAGIIAAVIICRMVFQ